MMKKLTVNQHLANASDLDLAAEYLGCVIDRCRAAGVPKGSAITAVLAQFDGANRRGLLEELRGLLEREYQQTASECEQAKHGNFPYRSNCPARRRCKPEMSRLQPPKREVIHS